MAGSRVVTQRRPSLSVTSVWSLTPIMAFSVASLVPWYLAGCGEDFHHVYNFEL